MDPTWPQNMPPIEEHQDTSPTLRSRALSALNSSSDMRKIKVTRSTGNVFRDLGLPPAEATLLLSRADLLLEIERVVRERRLTSPGLATRLGVSRRRIDDLRRGRLRRFGTDALIDIVSRLGVTVRVVARPTTRRRVPTKSAKSNAFERLRRVRRPLPPGFAFSREEANER